MTGKQLKNSILQWAIQGKLVPQDPNDEPASVLLERIRAEKARLVKEGKIKKDKNESIIFRGDDNSHYEKFLATGEVKCIDDEIPFEIPQGWEWERLGNIASIKGGKRIPVGEKLVTTNTGHIYIRVADMKENSVKSDDVHYITETVYQKIKSYTISKDDLYITVAGTIGSIGEIPEFFNNANLTENADKIVFNFIDKKFLMYCLLSSTVQTQIKECTTKVGQPKLAIARIANLLVPIPPLSEQHRIVNQVLYLIPIVEKYSKCQILHNKLNSEIKEKLRKSILQEAIQGKLVPQIAEEGTAQELLEQIKAEKQKLVKEGKLKKKDITDSVIFRGDDNRYYEQVGGNVTCIEDELPFEIPASWAWCRIGEIADLYTGNSISESEKKAKYTNVDGMRYIGTKDVSFNYKINYDNGIAIPEGYRSKFKIAPIDSILLCVEGGSAGRKIALTHQEVCFGNKLCCFSFFAPSSVQYVYDYLQSASFYDSFSSKVTGIIGGVGAQTLKSLFVPLPPIGEQVRIVAQIEKLFEQLR